MNIIGVIPARSESKRLKNKNILPILDKPLINWTIDEALSSKYLTKDNLYVSTESDIIKSVVKDKCRIIDRPKELAGDTVWMQEPVTHAVEQIHPPLVDDDLVVILQANSPQMDSNVIDLCIERVMNKDVWEISTIGEDLVNNSHIHVIKKRVCYHVGKANYNTFYRVDWIDVHTIDDYNKVKKILEESV